MEIDETCLSNSYKSMNDFFEEMELDSELLYQFYLAFRGQQISFPMKMYDRELVRKRIENMIEQENCRYPSIDRSLWFLCKMDSKSN